MKRKILLCEDDEGIIDATTILLEEKGYLVKTVKNGKDIISAISLFKPDVILLDLWLPLQNGDIIAKKLKAHPEYTKIPLIIMSANRDIEEVARESGAYGFLPKPFDIDDLESMVESLFVKS